MPLGIRDPGGGSPVLVPLDVDTISFPQGFPLLKRLQTEQPPGSSQAFTIGDGVDLAGEFAFRAHILASTATSARTSITSLESTLDGASTLYLTFGGLTYYREVLALRAFSPTPVGPGQKSWRIDVVMLPKFARWTTTYAATLAAYEAATKAIV